MGMDRGLTRIATVLVVAGLIGAACGSDGESSDDTSPPATEAETTDTDAPVETEAPPETEPPATEAPVETDPPADTEVPTDDEGSDDGPAETDPPDDSTAPAEYDFSAIGPIVDGFVSERGLNGAGLLVVDAADGVVHEEYWGEFGPERISLIASASKSVAAIVLNRLDDDGVLDLDQPVAEITGWDANPEITTAQLLSNSSGLIGLAESLSSPPYLCSFVFDGTLAGCAETVFTTPEDDDQVIPPDTEFRYGGAQWQIAGAVAEIASGETWDELIQRIVVEPCGLESLGFANHFSQYNSGFDYPADWDGDPASLAPTENPNIEGGAYTAPGDYAELLLMQLRGGMCGENQVVSPDALDTMHSDRIAEVYDGSAGEGTGYGMGWWVDRGRGLINDPGAYGAYPWLDLDDGYGAYLVIELNSPTGGELASLLFDPVEEAVLAAG